MHRHHLLNTGYILILPILKRFFYLINLIFKLRVGYHVGLVFKLIVCEGQKSPYVWGKTPVWAFSQTSVRAFASPMARRQKLFPPQDIVFCLVFNGIHVFIIYQMVIMPYEQL